MKSLFKKQYVFVLPVFILVMSFFFVFYQNCGSPFEVAELDLEENSFDVFDPFKNKDQLFLLEEDSLSLIEAENLLSAKSSSLNGVRDLKAHGQQSVLFNQTSIEKSILSLQVDKKNSIPFSVFVRIKNIYNQDSKLRLNIFESQNEKILKEDIFSFQAHHLFEWFLVDVINIQEGLFEIELELLTEGLSVDLIALSSKTESQTQTLDRLDAIDKAIIENLPLETSPTIAPTAVPTTTPQPTIIPTTAPTTTPRPTVVPTAAPTTTPKPTVAPTTAPTATPIQTPTPKPSVIPTTVPNTKNCPSKNDLFLNPFNKNSAHHRPIGTGANYAEKNHSSTQAILAQKGKGTVNAPTPWGAHFIRVSASDPMRTITRSTCTASSSGIPVTFRFPAKWPISQDPSLRCWDNVLMVYDASADTGIEFYRFDPINNQASISKPFNLRGSGQGVKLGDRIGSSASGMSVLNGALRAEEIRTPGLPIRHSHHVAVPRRPDQGNHVLSKGIQWPATSGDYTSAYANENLGPIPYGGLLAIPPESKGGPNLDSLGLSEPGRRLAQSFRDYGVYVIDGAGQVTMRPSGDLGSLHTTMRDDFRKLWLHLRLVLNSVEGANARVITGTTYSHTGSIGTPSWPAGGGTPLAPNCAYDAQ